MARRRQRMLAVVGRFKWVHIDYIRALSEHFDVLVAWSGEGGRGAAADGLREGLRGVPIGSIRDVGAAEVRSRLAAAISDWQPDVVHLMYYNHDDLTLMVRELVGRTVPVVYECRDPQTTLSGESPGSDRWNIEREAVEASDARSSSARRCARISSAAHGLELRATSLIVQNGFARHTSPPRRRSSPQATAGFTSPWSERPTISPTMAAGMWTSSAGWSLGARRHSHFFEPPAFDMGDISLDAYHALARELDDYHLHPAVPHRQGTALSELVSRYDLMGVFHELEARYHNESATLAVCMPTKAVCGWLHGGIPVVCFPHYRGLVEQIEAHDIGFVIESWEDLGRLASDREAIAAATDRTLACRDRFTNERNAERIAQLVGRLGGKPNPKTADGSIGETAA